MSRVYLESQTKSYVTASIISIGLLIFSIVAYLNLAATLLGFIAAVVFSVLTGTAMIMGGFWFIIIPLPIIYIWKAGCLKPELSMGRRVLLGFAAVISVILVFVFLFAI